ncbi:MAG TPA: galactokinase [Candidatus Saccharimonadales bacterium]|nr:galactokinase [Candidatus Saccharimonadales bacterium]
MNLQAFADQTARKFSEAFQRAPQWIAAAPGRVNLIGEHTDYNDGFVLPMGIERFTVLAASPNNSRIIQVRSATNNGQTTIDLEQPIKPGNPSWANYILGVIDGFIKRGQSIPGFDLLIDSNVPIGGGLSSSAALEVGMATLLEEVTGFTLNPVDKALLAQKAEQDFAGVPCGIMDQFTSTMAREGHLLLLDCRSRTTELVPLTDPSISILITNTNVKHELTGGEYAERRAQCENAAGILGVPSLRSATMSGLKASRSRMDDMIFRRARHVITEIKRTTEAAREIRGRAWSKVGELMYASHFSLRDDFEVSCPELDLVVELARDIGEQGGVYGCRMTGGGFGGCTVSLVQSDRAEDISQDVARLYQNKTGIAASIFSSRPGPGATILK